MREGKDLEPGRGSPSPGACAPDCLHFREVRPQPAAQGKNKKFRWWECIECGTREILSGSVFLWVAASYGKWRRKK